MATTQSSSSTPWSEGTDAMRLFPLQDRLSLLAVAIESSARELDALWQPGVDDGEVMMRVVEASHALHKAVLALEGEDLIGRAVA